MPRIVALIALAALLAPAAAPAPAAAAEAAAEDPGDRAKPKRLLCRGARKTIGSHMRAPRRCRTADEWQREDEASNRLPISGRVVSPGNEGRQRPQ